MGGLRGRVRPMTDPELLQIDHLDDDQLIAYLKNILRKLDSFHAVHHSDAKVLDDFRRTRRRFVVAANEAMNRGLTWINSGGYTIG